MKLNLLRHHRQISGTPPGCGGRGNVSIPVVASADGRNHRLLSGTLRVRIRTPQGSQNVAGGCDPSSGRNHRKERRLGFPPSPRPRGEGGRGVRVLLQGLPLLLAVLLSMPHFAAELAVNEGLPLLTQAVRPVFEGRSNAEPGTEIVARLGETEARTQVLPGGFFRLEWPADLSPGTYTFTFELGGGAPVEVETWVQPPGSLPRKPIHTAPTDFVLPVEPEPRDFYEITDRWRLPAETSPLSDRRIWRDPYRQSVFKGDAPIQGDDRFLILSATSDTLLDSFRVPTPSGVSTQQPTSIEFFGDGDQRLLNQNLGVALDYYQGSTAFKPFDWRWRASVIANGNFFSAEENAVVGPDVRRSTSRERGFLALQELFYERKLRDLSAAYDFVSIRAGIQPFSSDFRGFVYTDTNLGVRLFGNAQSNRWQYNLAFFERLEKDTNSGLNQFEFRGQRVLIANAYRQDTFRLGYTLQASLHLLQDDASFHLDDNGFLARPDPVGSARPHAIEAAYLGVAGLGHFGRLNIDHALYAVFGRDELQPIAGPDILGREKSVDIGAFFAAAELSYDRDWLRPRFAFLYSSGDSDPTDRDARGFAPIFDNPAFAGGGFSYWNRLGIRLAGTAVSLVNRGSLVPDLRASKEEGQPGFVNPGLRLLSIGLDAELRPELKLVATANYLEFDDTATLELLTFQSGLGREIGVDLSLGARWRPRLDNNIVVAGGIAALLPGTGFEDIYEDVSTLYGAFASLTLLY
jgi:hypothetical protein